MTSQAHERSKHDVTEDEDQGIKQQEIIDLLVAAGYFRARIKGLSPFDKIIGGMVWCMESCYYDVDVDILFQENSTIGQKIALTEKIVQVLPKMGCPHIIEPHQIQGLDFIHIFPVIQWLVRKSVHVRGERGEFLRNYAVRQYHTSYNDQQSTELKLLWNKHKMLKEKFAPRRIFRRTGDVPNDQRVQIQTTLMEYGCPGKPNVKSDISKTNEFEEGTLETLEFDQVPLKAIGSLISSQAEQLKNVNEQFAELTIAVKDTLSKSDLSPGEKKILLEEKRNLEHGIQEDAKKQAEIMEKLEKLKNEPEQSEEDM